MAALPGQPGDDRIAAEQAALRRVATLVARGAPPGEVFAAVAEEAVRLLRADYATMGRYDPEGSGNGGCRLGQRRRRLPRRQPVGLGGRNLPTPVFQTGRPARIDD